MKTHPAGTSVNSAFFEEIRNFCLDFTDFSFCRSQPCALLEICEYQGHP